MSVRPVVRAAEYAVRSTSITGAPRSIPSASASSLRASAGSSRSTARTGTSVVATPHQLVERAVELLLEQAGKGVGGVRAALERDGLAVCEPDAFDRDDAPPEQRLVRCRVALGCVEEHGARRDAEAAELVGQPRRAGELELRHCNERPAVAALAALEPASLLECAERLPQGHAAHAEALGELPFGG